MSNIVIRQIIVSLGKLESDLSLQYIFESYERANYYDIQIYSNSGIIIVSGCFCKKKTISCKYFLRFFF